MRSIVDARLVRFEADSRMSQHAHSSAVLGVVLGGAYEERTRGRVSQHAVGDMLFCPAGEPHAQSFSAEGATKLLLWLEPSILEDIGRRARLEEAPFARCVSAQPLARRLASELACGDDFSAMVADGLALEIAGLFCRSLREADDEPACASVGLARDYLHARAGETCSLAEVAAATGCEPAVLSRGFRTSFGMSVGDYARRLRLERAADRIASTRAPLSEIALECGFCDQAHMSRSFKAAYGTTPRRWRLGR
jgi:AraC family transcriptional regulator